MTCKNCGHQFGWHGDRAILACQPDVAAIVRLPHPPATMVRKWQQGQCNCPGWA